MKKKEKEAQKGFISSMRIINTIIREMSEESPARTAKIGDTTGLSKVEFPEKGGILTYLKGYEQPYRGFPYFEMVERVNDVKKISKKIFGKIYHNTKGIRKLKLLLILPLANPLLSGFRYAFWFHIKKFRMKSVRYSQAVREIYRAFTALGESEEVTEWRDLMCMILEFDNAYRYRFQDVVSEMNKDALAKKPLKEIRRLLDLIIEREVEDDLRDRWIQMRDFGCSVLRFMPKITDLFQRFLLEINLEEIGLSKEDRYFCAMRSDYNFGFCLREEEKCKLGAPQDRGYK